MSVHRVRAPRLEGRRSAPVRGPELALSLVVIVALLAACTGGSAALEARPATAASPPAADAFGAVPEPGANGGAAGAAAGVREVGTAASPAAAGSPPPTATPAPSLPPPTEPFAMNLAESGDYVRQYTFEWCVGASIQMTLNMVLPQDDRSRSLQQRLWERARDLSSSRYGGANPVGWTAALDESAAGPYALVSEPDLAAAIRRAAAAIRATGRPVGLVMWRGRHAWVMSGFTALGDPATTPNFQVTRVRVLDPLYPHGSDVWGPSPKPNSLLTAEELGRQFVARPSSRSYLGAVSGYVLVLPVPAA